MPGIKNLNIVIASHVLASGPALELENYLIGKASSVAFVGHPFMDRSDKASFYRLHKGKTLVFERQGANWSLPEPLMRLKEALFTLGCLLLRKEKIDLYIGSDNYLAFLGLVLKKIGKVDDVILYTIDYVPQRFKNKILNWLYHFFDSYCLKNCKVVWNVSEKIAEAREEFDGLIRSKCVPQILVPLGIWYDRIPRISVAKRDKNTIVFMGHVLKKQGLDVVFNALPLIRKKIPSVRLVVVGKGPYLEELKKLSRVLGVSRIIDFKGYIEDHRDVEEIIAQSTVAVATYVPDPESFTYFADPGKIKNYLAAGLPVFITDVPAIAKVLDEKKCGVICEYDGHDLSEKIIKLLKNKRMLSLYSKRAAAFAKDFDWNSIFKKALVTSL